MVPAALEEEEDTGVTANSTESWQWRIYIVSCEYLHTKRHCQLRVELAVTPMSSSSSGDPTR